MDTNPLTRTVRISGTAHIQAEKHARAMGSTFAEACQQLLEIGWLAVQADPGSKSRLRLEVEAIHAQASAQAARELSGAATARPTRRGKK